MVQMGPIFMSPIIGTLIEQFPQYSASTVQMVMTFPNLVVVLVSLFIGKLETNVTKKNLCLLACASIFLGVFGLFTFHNCLPILFAFSGCIGIGVGILLSITATMISIYYQGEEQASLMGLQNTFNNLGGMVLNILGGILASIAWYYDFLAPLILIPGFLMVFSSVPNQKGEKKESVKVSVPKNIFLFYIVNIIFAILFNMMPTNISILIGVKGLGGTSFSGIVTAIFLCGGALGGILYPMIKNKLEDRTIGCAFLNLGLGFFIISMANSALVLLIGSFIGGCSITLVMSQMVYSISQKTESYITPTAISYLMAFNNLGNFISPTIFSFLPGNDIAYKFTLSAVICLVCCALVFVLFKGKEQSA